MSLTSYYRQVPIKHTAWRDRVYWSVMSTTRTKLTKQYNDSSLFCFHIMEVYVNNACAYLKKETQGNSQIGVNSPTCPFPPRGSPMSKGSSRCLTTSGSNLPRISWRWRPGNNQ